MLRLLRDTGFEVEDLIELYAPDDAETHPYYSARHRRLGAEVALGGDMGGAQDRLTLASTSPQRRAILEQLRIPFEVVDARRTSRTTRPGSSRPSSCARTQRAKPLVHAEGRRDARRRHRRRARRRVSTASPTDATTRRGCCTSSPDGRTRSSPASACSVPDEDIVGHELDRASHSGCSRRRRSTAYLESGEWEGRAGAYAIQGLGGRLVERIDGDYLNVVGLPGALLVSTPRAPRAESPANRAGRLGSPHGLVQVPHRLRRPRHGGRPRHREHARLRPRTRHRALGAVGRRDRPADGRGARGRRRGEAHARAHARARSPRSAR